MRGYSGRNVTETKGKETDVCRKTEQSDKKTKQGQQVVDQRGPKLSEK